MMPTEKMYYFYEDLLSPKMPTLLEKWCGELPLPSMALLGGRINLKARRAVTLSLVRRALVKEFDCPVEVALQVCIKHHPSGQPYLLYPSEFSQELWQISISHTSHYVGFSLSRGSCVAGFDLEDMSKQRDVVALSRYAFSPLEQKYVQGHGELGFYFLWGAKEALAKLKGQGLSFAMGLDFEEKLQMLGSDVKSIVGLGDETFEICHKVDGDLLITIVQKV